MKNMREIKPRKRNDGVYEIRFSKNGKQYSIYSKSKIECREKYSKEIESIKERKIISRTMLFITWYDKYIDLYKKDRLKPNTLKNLIGVFQNHILPYLAKKPLKRITSLDIQSLLNKMKNIPRQQTIVYTQLNACFEQAYILSYIKYNPCGAIVINKNKGGTGKALTKEQEKKLIEYLEENNLPIKNLIYLYLTTGMRRSELLNLKLADLNFENNEIYINGSKTENSKRTIQVNGKILNLIPKHDIPFKAWTPSKVNHSFKAILKALNIKDISIHSLRHTFATRCIEQGISMVVVQKWLGHASIKMTIDRYTHIDDALKKESANALEFDFLK